VNEGRIRVSGQARAISSNSVVEWVEKYENIDGRFRFFRA
jgi:hypothetical protein